MHDEGKILLSVEMLNKFSKCRPQRLSSMMRGKRCFFFLSVGFGEFSKSCVAQKKRRQIKSSCTRCLEAAKLFLIDELKLEQFFF